MSNASGVAGPSSVMDIPADTSSETLAVRITALEASVRSLEAELAQRVDAPSALTDDEKAGLVNWQIIAEKYFANDLRNANG